MTHYYAKMKKSRGVSRFKLLLPSDLIHLFTVTADTATFYLHCQSASVQSHGRTHPTWQRYRLFLITDIASSIRATQPAGCSVSVSTTDRVTWFARFRAPLTISVPWEESLSRFSAWLCSIAVTPVKCQVRFFPPMVQVT